MRLLLPGDAVLGAAVPRPWAPQGTHTGPSSVDPRGAPGGPISSLHNCQEADTCALSGGTCSDLVSPAWAFPAPRNPDSFLTPALKETGWVFPSPPRTPAPDFYATVSFMIVISPWDFFFSGDISIMEMGRFQSAL